MALQVLWPGTLPDALLLALQRLSLHSVHHNSIVAKHPDWDSLLVPPSAPHVAKALFHLHPAPEPPHCLGAADCAMLRSFFADPKWRDSSALNTGTTDAHPFDDDSSHFLCMMPMWPLARTSFCNTAESLSPCSADDLIAVEEPILAPLTTAGLHVPHKQFSSPELLCDLCLCPSSDHEVLLARKLGCPMPNQVCQLLVVAAQPHHFPL